MSAGKKPARREFIPAIREGLARGIPADNTAINEMIDHWRDGEEPAHPLEAGVFACCDEMAQRLDDHVAKDDPEKAERHESRGTTADAQDAREFYEAQEEVGDRCTNPDGHVWDKTAGEADEARLSGDYANDSIRCIYCGADGDA